MPAHRMREFLNRYGAFRLHQMMEILSDPNDPAPQEHIAQILHVSKSTVSKYVKSLVRWTPELVKEAKEEAEYRASFEEFHARQTKEHVSAVVHHAAILHLDENGRA